MRLLKKVVKVFAIILLVLAAIGFIFFPATIHVEEGTMVNKPAGEIYAYVSNMKNYNDWSPWYGKDTGAVYIFTGPASGPGAGVSWKSEVREVGHGTITIIDAKPDSLLVQEVKFEDQGSAMSSFRFRQQGNSTHVTWAFDMKAGANPLLRILGGIFMKPAVSKEFEKGLENIRRNLESMKEKTSFTVEELKVAPVDYLYVRDSSSLNNISAHLGESYGAIMGALKKQKLEMAGMPFAIYYNDDVNNFIFDAGIPVNKKGSDENRVRTGKMISGNALVVHFFGPYENTGLAHKAIAEYAAANKKVFRGAPWEVYVTDPGVEKDTAKWQTDIYYPVQ